MNRKIVSFEVNEQCFVALCDDGTLWSLGKLSACWIKLPPIPSDEEYAGQSKAEIERLNLLMGHRKNV